MTKVLILYYSTYGHIETMAHAVAEGAKAGGAIVDVKRVPEIVPAETLENAVRRASEAAVAGDVILLAPACASFDQFQSYEHRGRVFKEIVHSLAMARST